MVVVFSARHEAQKATKLLFIRFLVRIKNGNQFDYKIQVMRLNTDMQFSGFEAINDLSFLLHNAAANCQI